MFTLQNALLSTAAAELASDIYQDGIVADYCRAVTLSMRVSPHAQRSESRLIGMPDAVRRFV